MTKSVCFIENITKLKPQNYAIVTYNFQTDIIILVDSHKRVVVCCLRVELVLYREQFIIEQ